MCSAPSSSSTTRSNSARSMFSMAVWMLFMSRCMTLPSTSPPLIWSCETWMRWMDVSLPRISSCSAFCMLGYPS